ncbi:hypothetical protein EGM88_04985 [Aureibaculum marinum]|uniref:Uncharacterized protein n=1 Tax=Aureibaculum marinum TaxID=2487930 RepID=A0A3N4P1V2_9FLAO|nr:hypothetical protein [Aureibaculum marinum]RPD98550.1 hypothetical protein EGM88_04985 [Aureibaculum marinum]
MAKVFSILSSCLILFQSFNINIEDVSKFKILWEHAEYHQKTYGDSFVDFLIEHYSSSDLLNGDEHQEHKSLPFKSSHHSCQHLNPPFTFVASNFDLNFTPFVAIPFNFFYKDSISYFEKPSVFQPPKHL